MTHQFSTPEELVRLVGERLKQQRLRKHLDQAEAAARAGVSLRALSRLENGHGSTLETFLRVLKGLRLADKIDALVPLEHVSPLDLLRLEGKAPQRIRKRKAKP